MSVVGKIIPGLTCEGSGILWPQFHFYFLTREFIVSRFHSNLKKETYSSDLWLFYFLWSWLFVLLPFQPDLGVVLPLLSCGIKSLSARGFSPFGHVPKLFLQIPLPLSNKFFMELHVSLGFQAFSHTHSQILHASYWGFAPSPPIHYHQNFF